MLASGSTISRCGASSRRIESCTPRSITPLTTTAPSRSRHATTLAGESAAATTGIDGIDKSSGVGLRAAARNQRVPRYFLSTSRDLRHWRRRRAPEFPRAELPPPVRGGLGRLQSALHLRQ